jgi:hypothetical protein
MHMLVRKRPLKPIFLTSPLGANFDPRGEDVPQCWILSPGGEILSLPLHSSKQYIENVHPWGERRGDMTFPLGDKFHPWGPSSPLGAKFTLGAKVEVENGPLALVLRCISVWGGYQQFIRTCIGMCVTTRFRCVKTWSSEAGQHVCPGWQDMDGSGHCDESDSIRIPASSSKDVRMSRAADMGPSTWNHILYHFLRKKSFRKFSWVIISRG